MSGPKFRYDYTVRVVGFGWVTGGTRGEPTVPPFRLSEDRPLIMLGERSANITAAFLRQAYRDVGQEDMAKRVTVMVMPVGQIYGQWYDAKAFSVLVNGGFTVQQAMDATKDCLGGGLA